MAELGRVVAERGLGAPHPHAFLPEPADQPEELTVTLEGVPAEVAGRERGALTAATSTPHNTEARTIYRLQLLTHPE